MKHNEDRPAGRAHRKTLPPSEHRIAYAMKKSRELALFEQIVLDMPLDGKAKRDAMRAFENSWRSWFINQHLAGAKIASNPLTVIVAVEALGLRDIRLQGEAGITALTADGTPIQPSARSNANADAHRHRTLHQAQRNQ